jgi:1,2-dihydroxy-3-keto-5-methylthiopentene dioxygenase
MRATWLDDDTPIDAASLVQEGLLYERLPMDDAGYQPRLDELRDAEGYGTQDEVRFSRDTEGYDAICEKFWREHHHSEDEVRFILDGAGVFDVRSLDDRWMRVLVETGDLLIVPAGRHHRFKLTEEERVHAVRLFQDPAGWVAHYRDADA